MSHKRALVLSGGGARGAYQVGVLKAVAERTPPGEAPFAIVTGVSVGALNAAVIGTHGDDFHRGAAALEEIWRSLHCENVYKTDNRVVAGRVLAFARSVTLGWAGAGPAPQSLLDNSPLRDLLSLHVNWDRMAELIGSCPIEALAITASSYGSGQAVTFYEARHEIAPWSRARRIGRREKLGTDHVLASSALPLVFPAISLGGTYFGDGALRENAPLSAAIHLGCDDILTIGARDLKIDEHEGKGAPYPSVGLLSGQLLDILFNDNMSTDIERLERVNSTVCAMSPVQREIARLRPIGLTRVVPSEDIRDIAGTHAEEMPGSIRTLLRTIGAFKEPYVLPSYLNFEPGYIGALIDLGYRDGMATDGLVPRQTATPI